MSKPPMSNPPPMPPHLTADEQRLWDAASTTRGRDVEIVLDLLTALSECRTIIFTDYEALTAAGLSVGITGEGFHLPDMMAEEILTLRADIVAALRVDVPGGGEVYDRLVTKYAALLGEGSAT